MNTSALPIPILNPPPSSSNSSGAEVYRAVSRAAVVAVVLGLLGFLAFLSPLLVPLPLIGMVFALLAFSGFRKFPDELVGRPAAVIGALLCGVSLFGAPLWHGYIYATEVPEGYVRVNFSSLMGDNSDPDAPPPSDAQDLDGQSVFIKGYIHPSSMDAMMSKRFVLVPDLGTCCFGGQPPLTHMIEVTLTGDQYAMKSLRKNRLAGTLRVNGNMKPVDGLTGVYYQLRADILK